METIAFDSIAQVGSFAGLSAVTLALVQLGKPYVTTRFIPAFAAGVGTALGLLLALYMETDVALGVFNGLFAGIAATGTYENVTKPQE